MAITLGHDEGFGDLDLIFKVTEERNWSNLSVFGGEVSVSSENITGFINDHLSFSGNPIMCQKHSLVKQNF